MRLKRGHIMDCTYERYNRTKTLRLTLGLDRDAEEETQKGCLKDKPSLPVDQTEPLTAEETAGDPTWEPIISRFITTHRVYSVQLHINNDCEIPVLPVANCAEENISQNPACHKTDMIKRDFPVVVTHQVPLWTYGKERNRDGVWHLDMVCCWRTVPRPHKTAVFLHNKSIKSNVKPCYSCFTLSWPAFPCSASRTTFHAHFMTFNRLRRKHIAIEGQRKSFKRFTSCGKKFLVFPMECFLLCIDGVVPTRSHTLTSPCLHVQYCTMLTLGGHTKNHTVTCYTCILNELF